MTKPTITVTSAQAVMILRPSLRMKNGYIQNNSDNDCRLALDGGAPAGNTNPTASRGFLLAARTQLWLSQFYGTNMVGILEAKPDIWAIAVSGDVSLDVGTDDPASI